MLFEEYNRDSSTISGILLVKARAEAMQYCSDLAPSGMMTVFFGASFREGLACQAAKKFVEEKYGIAFPVCQVANYLYAGAKVIAGHEQVLENNRLISSKKQGKKSFNKMKFAFLN